MIGVLIMDTENELVFLTDATLDAEMYTTDEVIADCSGNSLHAVKQLIGKHQDQLNKFGILAFEMRKLDGRGRPKKVYMLNQQQATFLITLLDNTPQVVDFKVKLVKQFFKMQQELNTRKVNYDEGKQVSKKLGDAVKANLDNPKWYDYKNFNDLVYKATFGKNVKQLKAVKGIPESKDVSATELLNSEEQEKLEPVKNKVITLLELGMGYQAIKALITGNGVKQVNETYDKKKKDKKTA